MAISGEASPLDGALALFIFFASFTGLLPKAQGGADAFENHPEPNPRVIVIELG